MKQLILIIDGRWYDVTGQITAAFAILVAICAVCMIYAGVCTQKLSALQSRGVML